MAFLSTIIGKPVADINGECIGNVQDLVAVLTEKAPYPEIAALLLKSPRGLVIVPMPTVVVLIAPAIPLNCLYEEIIPYEPGPRDIFLSRDILDKQIIDTNSMRVVRVNDLEITRVEGCYYVANVDIGSMGLLRRIGIAHFAQNLALKLGRELPPGLISWENVELLDIGQPMRLKVPGERLADLHPADLAEIISNLSPYESSKFLESLDVKTVADMLEEVEPDFQASLVGTMPNEKVADLLEEMSPDEAADLLAELPDDRSQELLRLMEDEDEVEVRKLLAYPEDMAGGIMTTEYVAVSPELTARQVISELRKIVQEGGMVINIYVISPENCLVGSFSLQDLVLANPQAKVSQFMDRRLISVNLLDSQEKVAQMVAKYNLLAIPVVDNHQHLHGVVTADDALDKIIPTKWKKRLPRLHH